MSDTRPRIYVACLACYNEGFLVGLWHDAADLSGDMSHVELTRCAKPGHEEWAIHDHEGFGPYRVGEWADLGNLADVAATIESEGAPFLAWLANSSYNADHIENYADEYAGEWSSVEEYAAEMFTSCYDVPSYVEHYIAYDRMARDMVLSGDIWTADAPMGGVYIFRNS